MKKIIRKSLNENGRLSDDDIKECLMSPYSGTIENNKKYYEGKNPYIHRKHWERAVKGNKPNELLPSPYASTIADDAGAFSFSEIEYTTDEKSNDYLDGLKDYLYSNNNDVRSLDTGIEQLSTGVSYDVHYVDKERADRIEARFVTIDPVLGVPVYDTTLKTELIAFIFHSSKDEVTVYYDNFIDTYLHRDSELTLIESTPNDFKKVPVSIYFNGQTGEVKSITQKVEAYIDCVDAIISGAWNENGKLADAILLIARSIQPEQVEDLEARRILQGFTKEESDATKYLIKDIPVTFIDWLYKMCVSEIHKHTGVLDWQDSDIGSAASGDALEIRLFNMTSKAKRHENYNREGQYRTIDLYNSYYNIVNPPRVNITYKHTLPENIAMKAQQLNGVTFISESTKAEMIGLDSKKEKELKGEEQTLLPPLNIIEETGTLK